MIKVWAPRCWADILFHHTKCLHLFFVSLTFRLSDNKLGLLGTTWSKSVGTGRRRSNWPRAPRTVIQARPSTILSRPCTILINLACECDSIRVVWMMYIYIYMLGNLYLACGGLQLYMLLTVLGFDWERFENIFERAYMKNLGKFEDLALVDGLYLARMT